VTGLVCSGRFTLSGRVHSLRERQLHSSSQITLVALGWQDVMLDFCCICRPNSNSVYFTAQRYASVVYAIDVCLCDVDVAYRWLSDWTHLQWALHS